MGWMGGFSDPNWNFPCICCVLWVVQETPLILAGFFHISAASARTSGRLALSLYISYTFRLNWHVFIMKMLLASHKAAQTPGLAQRLPLLTGRTAQSFHKECGHRESGRVEAILKSSLCPTEWNKPEREKQMLYINTYMGIPRWLSGEESTSNAGDTGSLLQKQRSGKCPGTVNGNSLQYSCLGNPMDRGAWWATVHGSQTIRHNSTQKHTTTHICGN